MPSQAAQAYFNSFTPGQQEQIRKTWGGQNLMDQWYQNALAAGATDAQGSRLQGQGATEASAAAGGMTAQQLREKAKQEGWSEDFQRFDDRTLQGWINDYWDPARGRFRSQHAPPGATGDWIYVDKPTEGIVDPSGIEWGPYGNKSGVNLSAMGMNTLRGSIATGGQPGGGSQAQASPVVTPGSGGLQRMLEQLLANQGSYLGQYDDVRGDNDPGIAGGAFRGSGGIWYTPSDAQPTSMPAMPAAPTPGLAPVAPGMVPAPGKPSSTQLQSALSEFQAKPMSASPVSSPQPFVPMAAQGQLGPMMAKRNQIRQNQGLRRGSWFGGGL